MHKLKIIKINRQTKKVESEVVEQYLSIYNLQRRKLEIEDLASRSSFDFIVKVKKSGDDGFEGKPMPAPRLYVRAA